MKEKRIPVMKEVEIVDLRTEDPDKYLHVMIADVTDAEGVTNEKQVILKFDSWWSDEKIEERVRKHVKNIIVLQSRNKGGIKNIVLFNLTYKEGEEQGYVTKPSLIEHGVQRDFYDDD